MNKAGGKTGQVRTETPSPLLLLTQGLGARLSFSGEGWAKDTQGHCFVAMEPSWSEGAILEGGESSTSHVMSVAFKSLWKSDPPKCQRQLCERWVVRDMHFL